jgi:rhodanese-related sulfurtransferase
MRNNLSSDTVLNGVMWLIMALLLGYFAYFKGWIFSDFKNISPQEAYALLQEDNTITLIDVRSEKAFEKDHIKGAISLPMESVATEKLDHKTLLVYSERGESSVEASRILAKRGFKVLNLKGGVVFWIRAGYKVDK